MMSEALESVIRYARKKLMSEIGEMDDKTEGIACRGLDRKSTRLSSSHPK